MKRILSILLCLPLLMACEHEIRYTGEYEQHKLVLEVPLEEGAMAIDGAVTRTSFFLDYPSRESDRWLTDVTMSVQRGDGEVTTYTDSTLHLYEEAFHIDLDEPLRVGERIRICASHPTYGSAEGEDVVVETPQFTCESCEWDAALKQCVVRLRFSESLDPNGIIGISGVFNYLAEAEGNQRVMTYRLVTSTDNCFAPLNNAFSVDAGFNSKYDLFCNAEDVRGRVVELAMPAVMYVSAKPPYEVTAAEDITLWVTNYSKDAYLYRCSLYAYFGIRGEDDTSIGAFFADLIGLEETVQIYSNVKGGLGIVEAYSTQIYQKDFNE